MHAQAASPVALVLPLPPVPRRTPSLLSFASAASPRTPRSCGSPCPSIFVPPHPNRKSTDSWNSSNGPDDSEYEWKPEQVLLLSRTLDALPAHLVTPFNGPIPPSNLLDKIARGVSQAKGPVDWPHSLRATRVKLIELSRHRAKEQAAARQQREAIAEEMEYASEMETNYIYNENGAEKPVGVKKPLYRQSSMDFMLNAVGTDIQNNENLTRLSNRLQRAERQNKHPYSYSSRIKRPSSPSSIPSLINPSTPSSSTLNTLSSAISQRKVIRRKASSISSSSLSILSSSSSDVLPNPRVRHIMEYDNLPPTPPPKDTHVPKKTGTKRAPSFGALAQGARREYLSQSPQDDDRHRKHPGGCASSDEEEKARNKQVKKPRKLSLVATPPPDTPAPITPIASPVNIKGGLKSKVKPLHLINFKGSKSPSGSKKENKEKVVKNKKENAQDRSRGSQVTKPLPMHLQHRSTESPEINDVSMSPAPPASKTLHADARSPPSVVGAPRALKSAFTPLPESPMAKSTLLSPAADITATPLSPKVKTLRRVRRLAPARRISFSSLVPPGEEADADGEGDGEEKGGRIELGSAFQLH
ncbi:hypothetical protein Agabi119p4_5522 [Agaricus bisporus var. burnettii]|uniref:Uncharacterized protein n=1 Tax=Agaricus bisporus var. burnettii TaxID=192524 RepID=A0A8H7F1S7_AGABI|nr:hypothetical protein Agabi119p4_5522 [Agaricus bisporus var. burnettii]